MRFLRYIFLLLIFDSSYCLACGCKHGITIESSFKEADFVATVTIIEAKQFSDTVEWTTHSSMIHPRPPKVEIYKYYLCKAVIKKQYKGAKFTDTINISIPYIGKDCSILFENGHNYVIYGHSQEYKNFYTHICHFTKPYSKTEHKLLLRLSRKHNR